MLSGRDREAALLLLMLDAPSVGPRRLLDMIQKYGRAEDLYQALLHAKSTPDRVRSYLESADHDFYAKAISRTYEVGASFKLWNDPDYPANLMRWEGRPPVLFYKGDLSMLGERSLALVGRVDPTEDGIAAAHRFARKCVEHGITVVSGLAKGIDAASHTEALIPPPGVTYAVVGHGIDHAYPRENAELYEKIPQHGAILSQFRTGMGPQRWTFPARNEVMCTLALGTVIIEGKTGCGSIIQADFSFKHGRPVFLLSRNLQMPDSAWAHKLVARGAHVIQRFDQVLDVIERTLGTSWRQQAHAQPLFEVSEASVGSPLGAGAAMLDRPAAALFDIDGVIVDTREATSVAIAEIASRHTGRLVEPSSVNPVGKVHEILAKLGVPRAYDVYKAEYDSAFARAAGEIRVFTDVVEGMRKMKENGIHLGAVTAQPRRRADRMVPPEIRDLFDVFLCYNDTRGNKDEGIKKALTRLGVPSQRAMYIGDTHTDLEAARRAGVKGVGVLWGFSSESELRRWPSDILLEAPNEVSVDLVERLLGNC